MQWSLSNKSPNYVESNATHLKKNILFTFQQIRRRHCPPQRYFLHLFAAFAMSDGAVYLRRIITTRAWPGLFYWRLTIKRRTNSKLFFLDAVATTCRCRGVSCYDSRVLQVGVDRMIAAVGAWRTAIAAGCSAWVRSWTNFAVDRRRREAKVRTCIRRRASRQQRIKHHLELARVAFHVNAWNVTRWRTGTTIIAFEQGVVQGRFDRGIAGSARGGMTGGRPLRTAIDALIDKHRERVWVDRQRKIAQIAVQVVWRRRVPSFVQRLARPRSQVSSLRKIASDWRGSGWQLRAVDGHRCAAVGRLALFSWRRGNGVDVPPAQFGSGCGGLRLFAEVLFDFVDERQRRRHSGLFRGAIWFRVRYRVRRTRLRLRGKRVVGGRAGNSRGRRRGLVCSVHVGEGGEQLLQRFLLLLWVDWSRSRALLRKQ